MNKGILWNEVDINPAIQVKYGIKREIYPLIRQKSEDRYCIHYRNEFVDLKGIWQNSSGFGSLLQFKLKNISGSSLRITRLVFPAENGLDKFLKGFKTGDISFYRNGYQSWSLSRSYRLWDKPLRPWLQVVSLVSSNMANLPSNNPGNLSSEMYTVISDLSGKGSFFAGQGPPFNQFFYIRFIVHPLGNKRNYFELVYDFGRKMIRPGEVVELDSIIIARGKTEDLLENYFRYIKSTLTLSLPEKNVTGWSSWYYYYNNISFEKIIKNLKILHHKKVPVDVIQVDDGYQRMVGDWFDLKGSFRNRMRELTDAIKRKGYRPGIWIAPFTADRKSRLVKDHPEYILRNEYGMPLVGGFNVNWPGRVYYGLDITNPRFEEYISKVITTIVREWGFTYLKLDFMYCACLRQGTHNNLLLSRAEIMKYGLKVIKMAAGEDVFINGCGMPLTPGIGLVHSMRIGPDTSSQWYKIIGIILRTGSMAGVHNSIRNNFVRSMMNRHLWINDPDCIMMRYTKTKLNGHERLSQINAAIITGGTFFISDNLEELPDISFDEIKTAVKLSHECFQGKSIVPDLMENAVPEVIFNTAGYLGIFNMKNHSLTKVIDLNMYSFIEKKYTFLHDVWTEERIKIPSDNVISFSHMPPHSSLLFKFI
ncbi:MAG: alpha-galactosidase [Spirochaetales bacterium]|nr:alpha-galactosidase [Spirochaetales bacterium]